MSYLGFCVYYVYNFTNHQTALGVIYFHNSLIQKNDWVTLLFVCILFITLQIIKLPRAWYLFISVWYKSMIQLLWFLVCIMFINLQINKLPRALMHCEMAIWAPAIWGGWTRGPYGEVRETIEFQSFSIKFSSHTIFKVYCLIFIFGFKFS